MRATTTPWRARAAALAPFVPWLLGAAGLGIFAASEVMSAVGEPAVPLDDSYIHLQYARALTRGAPFQYTPGAEPTPGATSLLWPVVLAPFVTWLPGVQVIWAAWVLGFAALAGVAHETRKLAEGLVTPALAWAAGAMTLAFGGLTWFAGSGMEVVPFAWALCRTARRLSEWTEGSPSVGPRELVALAWLLPLCRPEGILGAIAVAAVLALRPRGGSRAPAVVALAAVLAPSGVYLLATGSPISSTATAKWLPLNPYVGPSTLRSWVAYNVELFFGTLLDGRLWTSAFLPRGGRVLAWAALGALPVAGWLRRRPARAALACALALGALIPATYETFLVNRVRYIWPFTSGWLVGLAVLCDLPGARLQRWIPGARFLSWGLAAGIVAALASRIGPTVTDLAESAQAVHAQQVSLGRWVRTHLPSDARVGLNDTGAIAYFGERATFDVVGLTTANEAKYWAAGPGSRFEHYERLSAAERPTHFVVYPEWFAVDPLLGGLLTSRTVHATILGGPTMQVHVADYGVVDSGATPRALGRVVDSLDVADLESEAAHDYELLDATHRGNVVVSWQDAADGARRDRRRERFSMTFGHRSTLAVRAGADEPTDLEILVDGRSRGALRLEARPWQERSLVLPPAVAPGPHRVEVEATPAPMHSLHYWILE